MLQASKRPTTTTGAEPSTKIISLTDRIAARDVETMRAAVAECPTWTLRPGADAGGWTVAEMRRIHHPTVNTLPFVTLHEGNPFKVKTFWNDKPTRHGDHERGRHYARLLVAAMVADDCGGRPLEQVINAIIDDSIARRADAVAVA